MRSGVDATGWGPEGIAELHGRHIIHMVSFMACFCAHCIHVFPRANSVCNFVYSSWLGAARYNGLAGLLMASRAVICSTVVPADVLSASSAGCTCIRRRIILLLYKESCNLCRGCASTVVVNSVLWIWVNALRLRERSL